MNSSPVFVFALHRSGSTLLMRLLNCIPGLVIWGEHGGIINHLALMEEILRERDALNPIGGDTEKLREFSRNEGPIAAAFHPWAGPVTPSVFRQSARIMLQDMFSAGLTPGQRWGFKEIRYCNLRTATFLAELFPSCQFVLLERDLVEAAVSNILVSWSIDEVWQQAGDALDRDLAVNVVEDVAYGLLALRKSFDDIAVKFPERTKRVNYREFRDGVAMMESVAAYLDFDVNDGLREGWKDVLSIEVGATDKSDRQGQILNKRFIEEHLASALQRLTAEFAADGSDLLLMPKNGHRQRSHAYLLGDHSSNGGRYATLFI